MPCARVNGVAIHYAVRGRGPALLLLPGLGLDLTVFDELADRLDGRFTCLGVDHRGAGGSDAPPGPYAIADLAADAAAVLRAARIDGAVVLGHSLGGFVAQELALAEPGLVRGLALVGTAATGARDRLDQSPAAAAALDRRAGPAAEIARGNLLVTLGAAFLAAHPGALDRLLAGRLAHAPRGRGLAGQRAAGAAFDAAARLGRIAAPTAVVHGDADRVIGPACGARLAAAIPGATLHLLPGVGHMPFWEAPAELAGILTARFRGL